MEKRVLYGLVVMLMYLVGSGVGQGEVKLMTEEAKWEQLRSKAQLPIVLTITSSTLCGEPCVLVEEQVARLARTYANKIIFYKADITLDRSLLQQYRVLSVPTVIVYKNGKEILRYEDPSNWGTIYDQVSRRLFGSATASASDSPSPSPLGQ